MDVFNRAVEFGNALSSDGTRVTFDDFHIGFLVQQLQLVYRQQITRLFEISSNRQYYVIGRPQGNISMQRVVGPLAVSNAFVAKFGDGCKAEKNTLSLSADSGCGEATGNNTQAQGVDYTANNVILEQLTVGIQAGDMLITEGFQLMFTGLRSGIAA